MKNGDLKWSLTLLLQFPENLLLKSFYFRSPILFFFEDTK